MGRKICNYTLAILFLLSGYAFAGDKVTGNETVSGTLAVTGASTLSGGATVGSLNGIVKASGGALGTATADTDYSVPNGVETLTNKTYDTGGTGNVFKIGGVSITGLYGNTAKLVAGSGTLTSGTCAQFDASGNVVTTGSSCASSGSVLGGSIIGTSNEVSVSSNSNTIGSNVTLSLPQAIATGSSPTFAGLTLSGLTASVPVFTGSGKALASGSISGNTTELATVTGSLTTGDFAYFDASGNVKDSGDSASTFAPATSGQAILYGNNSGGFSNVTIGTGLSFTGGVLSSTAIPSGGIIMWSGSVASIPAGWYLCNGSNGTPDLRSRFVIGADSSGTYTVGATGNGSLPSTSVTSTLSSGKQLGQSTGGSNGHWTYNYEPDTSTTNPETISGSFGSGSTNIAVYYALAYIMKS